MAGEFANTRKTSVFIYTPVGRALLHRLGEPEQGWNGHKEGMEAGDLKRRRRRSDCTYVNHNHEQA